MTGGALIAATTAAARLRERVGGRSAEVDAALCEDGATVMLTAHAAGHTATVLTSLRAIGDADLSEFARHVERSLRRPRCSTV
jgi:hypothetical protein